MTKKANKDYVEIFADCDIYIPTRTVYLGSTIIDGDEAGTNIQMFESACKGLHIFDNDGTNETINVIMNNQGGDFFHGRGIYGTVRGCKSYVRMMCYGYLMSAGSFILQGADERCLDPEVTFMMHYGSNKLPEDHPFNNDRWTEYCKKMRAWMDQLYLTKINDKRRKDKKKLMKVEEVQEMLTFDTILSAEEAVKLGLADRIVEHY